MLPMSHEPAVSEEALTHTFSRTIVEMAAYPTLHISSTVTSISTMGKDEELDIASSVDGDPHTPSQERDTLGLGTSALALKPAAIISATIAGFKSLVPVIVNWRDPKTESIYGKTSSHDFEFKQGISLQQLRPLSLMFGKDFQYIWRIKGVAVSTSGKAVGPISADPSLQQYHYCISISDSAAGYLKVPDNMVDAHFQSHNVPINSDAASDSSNGIFNLDISAPRYMPLESFGVISKWALELFSFSSLYPSIVSDVMMHVDSTVINGPIIFTPNTVVPAVQGLYPGQNL
ncbi:MAG: hypothetical protein Q9179_005709 [Wetmoreana sp. 5 TL-2023]